MSEQTHKATGIHVKGVRCEDIEQLAVLYACDELDSTARAALQAHTSQCPACAAEMSRGGRLHQAIVSLDQPADSLDPAGLLLAQCRGELAEALDDRQSSSKQPGWRAILSPAAWWTVLRGTLIEHPAMSMAALVVMGFLAGVEGQRSRVIIPVAPQAAATVSSTPKLTPTPKLTEQQLRSAASANVTWVTPSGTLPPTVQVQLMSQTPMSIVGSPDDAEVLRALAFVLTNGQQFDSSVRLDSLDVLRTQATDPEVRRILCSAARTDNNPGVRRKALETLQGFALDPVVRQTILDALQSDADSGVRVAAINLLVDFLQSGGESSPVDPRILAALRDRARNDPNRDIRVKSAAALRQLGIDQLP